MSLTIDFSGKVALVTGAAQGIGLAASQAFARAGASIVLADRSQDVEQAATTIRTAGGSACHCTVDVSDSQSCEAMVELTLAEYGRLDFAFNNAGIGSYFQPVAEVADEDWQRMININLSGVFYGIKYQLPAMLASGGGVIINNSSVLGTRALPGTSVQYTAAKHGVIGLTRQVAVNHAQEGIRCVAICPGLIETPLTDGEAAGGVKKGGIDDEGKNWFIERTPMKRFGNPDDIAGAVLMLCSGQAGFVNGTHLLVDGGLTQG